MSLRGTHRPRSLQNAISFRDFLRRRGYSFSLKKHYFSRSTYLASLKKKIRSEFERIPELLVAKAVFSMKISISE
jgi:hypothetical protein